MSQDILQPLLGPSADPVAAGWQLRKLVEAEEFNGTRLLESLAGQTDLVSQSDPAILGGLLHVLHAKLMQWIVENAGPAEIDPQSVHRLDIALPAGTPNRHLLLHALAMARSDDALQTLIETLQTAPPKQWIEGAQILSPLMQHNDWSIDAVYPDLLECLAQPSLAAALLDLSNFLTRTGRTSKHPATDKLEMLNRLLGEVSGRLGSFEENPRTFGDDVQEVQDRLSEAVALAVALCDAVGLIGDVSAIGKLNQTVELQHRRVQCEAAGALAKLGDDLGKKRLLELANDPAARLPIQYADELGFGELIDEKNRSATATAEAEMALWLSQPQQMGVPPTHVEVIESRRMLWPSFEDPVDVNLVRFEYNFGQRQYSNVGITGPAIFALSADIADLPIEDIYAIYAGWQAEHSDIFTVPHEQFNAAQQRLIEPYQAHLDRLGYSDVKPVLLGFLLDEQAAIFSAVRDDTQCIVVTDGLETFDQPTAGRKRPLTPGDLFNLYKGRKMLRMFNP